MPSELISNTDYERAKGSSSSPWNTAYSYSTPGYANYSAGRGGGSMLSSAGSVPYGNLAASTNALMTQQAKAPFVANLPNYEQLVAQRSQNTSAQLRGEVPQDVVNQIIQGAAERGILTGSPGSQNTNASYLQALGLTSIGQQQAGSQNLSQGIADTPVPQLWNPSSLFVPEHLAGLEMSAAQAGMGAGRGMGGGSGGYMGTPNISSGVSPSWGGTPSQMMVGATGPFDEYQAPNYGGLPWGNTGRDTRSQYSNFDDPYDPGFWAGSEMPRNHIPGQIETDWTDIGSETYYQ